MKQRSIRRKLIVYFLSLLSIIFVLNLLLGAVHMAIVNRYEQIGENIFNQNELINATSRLILTYNVYRNAPIEANLQRYMEDKEAIYNIYTFLDKSIIEEDSRIAFEGVKNTINTIINDIDQGIAKIQSGDIEESSSLYAEANRKFDFVKQNVADLLLYEITHSANLQETASNIDRLVIIFGAILFIIIFILVVITSTTWSKEIITPLLNLDTVAKKISGGNLDVNVDDSLLKEQDEVGSLSQSFNIMIGNLRTSMQQLHKSNEEIARAKDSAEELVVLRTRELKEEHSRLLASINSLSLGFLIVSNDNQIFLKNKALMDIFGLQPTDTVSVEEISQKLGGFDIKTEAERCIKNHKVCEIKEIIFGKKILRGLVAPIATVESSQDVLGYALLIEDITEVKVIERSREEFFAVASHELRTPLTAIKGNMEMLKDFGSQISQKEKDEMISDALEGSTRLIAIVNDFLDVSRLEQNKISFDKQSFDIIGILEQLVREMEPVAAKKGLTITFEKPQTSIPPITADQNRTKQIIVNLLGNAINYTEHGSVTVRAIISGNYICVTVTDTGKGISPENQNLLFRKFQQAGEKILTRDSTKGTGLGLYISRLLVEGMGGTIELIQSTPGQGTTFQFTLPLASSQ